jgi:hypothetical protein
MRRLLPLLLAASCLLALIQWCYGRVLWRNEQFGYRDAVQYYYPLYERVQKEWEAGRWPLWEPEESGGMPLLGNPTAAVFYPGKLIYAVLPYAWGARLYVVAHTALAFGAMWLLMRSWGTSATGSTLSSLAYAFGAPILFLYSNVIFLVGAAWAPLGFRGADRWLRLGRRWGLLELAAVLALQTLGGDPESAYLTGVCAGGYAFGLNRARNLALLQTRRAPLWLVALLLGLIVVVWTVAVLELARHLPASPAAKLDLVWTWISWAPAAFWVGAGLVLLIRWWRQPQSPLVPMLAGLVGAAVLAVGLAAVAIIPALEFISQTGRAAGSDLHDIYAFSLEPLRAAELIWPNVFGTLFSGNRFWLPIATPLKFVGKMWVPSLYLGGLTLVLALGSLGFRGGPPWRGWMSAVAIVSLLASMGEFTSPIGWARYAPSISGQIGPHDPLDSGAARPDGKLRDGDGGIYWSFARILPGFRQFRYPSKLLSFTSLALSALAGIGWDGLRNRRCQRPVVLAAGLLVIGLLAMTIVTSQQARIVTAFKESPEAQALSIHGPLDVLGTIAVLQWSLLHGSIVYAVALLLALRGGRHGGAAAAVALAVLCADLALANARFIFTVDQQVLEQTPRVVKVIGRAERTAKTPSPGPFRVHRLPLWQPLAWYRRSSPDRVAEVVAWERDTIQPNYGVRSGIQYTYTMGFTSLHDYIQFFLAVSRPLDAVMARERRAEPGQEEVIYPRWAFDLWNTRYFVLTVYPERWRTEHPGIVAFLQDTEVIDSGMDSAPGSSGRARPRDWVQGVDFEIRRNRNHFPRAWLVHAARSGTSVPEVKSGRSYPVPPIVDPRMFVELTSAQRAALASYFPGSAPTGSESVTIVGYGPQRVELDARLERPGMVILADVYYPGWRLTIDGRNAPIHRANRMMRGAAVSAGRHRLIYTYAPISFRIGGAITLAAGGAMAVLGLVFTRRPVSARLFAHAEARERAS